MRILIPMAGSGQRFVDAGYTDPKPFIDVAGKPMIERVVESLGGPSAGRYIFILRAQDAQVIPALHALVHDADILFAEQPTAGAACTALLARDLINNTEPLLIANSDQIVRRWGVPLTLDATAEYDGAIYTFAASHPKWSYAAVDQSGRVWGVAEKQVISNRATCGIYWFRQGYYFARAADEMIAKNLRVNNEFYIAPVYNQMIAAGLNVCEVGVQHMHGLGTPEDLRAYLDLHLPRHRDS